MPKRQTRRNDTDYIRFRPYHAFTSSSPVGETGGGRKVVWWILLGSGLLAAMIVGAVFLLR